MIVSIAGMDDRHLLWTETTREPVLATPIYTINRSSRVADDGRRADYYVMDSPDWANIVALVDDEAGRRCFVMVRQFRHGTMRVELEFPGGVVDEGEDPADAVVRELREETGYVAREVELIGDVCPNPALMDNRCYTFVTHAVSGTHRSLDANEIIDVELVPVDDLLSGKREAEFDHAMMQIARAYFVAWAARQSA